MPYLKSPKNPKQKSPLGTASNETTGGGGLQLVCGRPTHALSSALVPQTISCLKKRQLHRPSKALNIAPIPTPWKKETMFKQIGLFSNKQLNLGFPRRYCRCSFVFFFIFFFFFMIGAFHFLHVFIMLIKISQYSEGNRITNC